METGVSPTKTRRPYKRQPVVMYPEPLSTEWEDPEDFAEAFQLHVARHGETVYRLHKAITAQGFKIDPQTLYTWKRGDKEPRSATGLRVLKAIERRYRLPDGYFSSKLAHPGRMITGGGLEKLSLVERRRLAGHLPDDFDLLPRAKRAEILAWVRTVIISGATDYRRYHANAVLHRFSFRFSEGALPLPFPKPRPLEERLADEGAPEVGRPVQTERAPIILDTEARDLRLFKTATLTTGGRGRNGVWNDETANQKMEHLGLLFGALAACPEGEVRGYGAPVRCMTFAVLLFPAVWDWYLRWREIKRGFFTRWESEMLTVVAGLTRQGTGWLRQSPHLAGYLRPIAGLITPADIVAATQDWEGVCEKIHRHAIVRAKEVDRVARVHRDPFEPILTILEADSPLGEYRKIAEEVRRRRPDRRRFPVAAAEATRGYLMIRMGLHLGLRQKNLRQLLVTPRGRSPTPERQLEALKRGELRWSDRDGGWEVFVPAVAFKNAGSTFFRKSPLRLILPDLSGLYDEIDVWLRLDRKALLKAQPDPRTFFVKTVKNKSNSGAYEQHKFYEAWRSIIQRYGIYNPYTGKGAIEGLLPHGSHNVRDVLATHVLKQTGSYEQASYAIQDTPDTIAEHYGRFLPQDKAALVAQVLNQVWGS
ncbi:hypothetical protein DDF62_03170 [Caulobacter radicis]|nr:hypothetical protein DDF62_03170 [Caulobacter radicis]